MAMTSTLEAHGDQLPDGPSDAVLLERVRAGDKDAYGELYLRHEPAATSLARYLTKSNHEADDVVADAFARVLRAIKGGAGPTEAFRPYLLTAVRRTVWRHAEESNHHRLAASEDEAELLDLRLAVEPEDKTDEGIILRAFQELPERWQLVLWHTEIEGQPPAAVAPLLGLSPNATAALAVRAREGLRQAFLQAHLQSQPAESCRFSVEHLGSFVRDGLGKRDNAKVEAHLADCEDCRELQADLGSLNKALRGVVGPAVLGAGAARWLQTRAAEASAGAGAVEHARSVAHRLRFPQAVGLAGAAAALVATLGLNSDLARPPADTDGAIAAADIQPLEADAGASRVVPPALAGTPAADTPGVQPGACDGAALPLSLPEGSTPTGAALIDAPSTGTEPTVVDPGQAAGLSTVDSGDAALVGRGAACVGNLIQPLDGAPPDTALAVSFLDRLGNLQILVVPEIVDVVQGAVRRATDLADAANARLQAYLQALAAQADQLTGGTGGGSSTPGTGSGIGPIDPGDVPVDVPDLPALPPATGGAVDGTVDDVGSILDGAVDSLNDTVNGLLG